MSSYCRLCGVPMGKGATVCWACGKTVPRRSAASPTLWAVAAMLAVLSAVAAAIIPPANRTVARKVEAQASPTGGLRRPEGICPLLAVEEVEAVMHAPVSFRQPGGDENRPSCTFVPGEGAMYPLTLEIQWSGGTIAVPGTTAGTGLGDRSAFGPLDSAIYVLQGDRYVSLQFGLSRGTHEEKVELAKKLLSRL